jgi:transcriptional regulator with XRE-family HTH domain
MTALTEERLLRKREWTRNYVRQQAYGRWNPWVDAAPVREHVQALRAAGVGRDRIAEIAGISRSTIALLLYGRPSLGCAPSSKIRPETAAKLLAIQAAPDLFPAEARVDAVGTRRRLQALAAAGWPGSYLADRAGWKRTYVSDLQRRPGYVYARTARTTAAMYDELVQLDPLGCGVSPTNSLRARRSAERLGWLPPQMWDKDIDDPDADPAAPDPEVAAPSVMDLSRGEQMDIVKAMTLAGRSLEECAARIGKDERTVSRWRRANGWKRGAA